MWIARFKLADPEDIYSPLCGRNKVDFYAVPYSQFTKRGRIHTFVGGTLSGAADRKRQFVEGLHSDERVKYIEQHHDFIFVHAVHPASREARAELRIFYDPQFIRVRPVHVASDGWEYWEVACLEREPLNRLVQAARRHYSGKLLSIKEEKMRGVTSMALAPELSEKQLEALQAAYREGYYEYPHRLTIPQLAKRAKKSYATFQEHLRKAERKLVEHFLRYR